MPDNTPDKKKEDRNRELENIAGNLLITEWQRDRLMEKLGYLGLVGESIDSSMVFKHADYWCKLTVKLEKEKITQPAPEVPEPKKKSKKKETANETAVHVDVGP